MAQNGHGNETFPDFEDTLSSLESLLDCEDLEECMSLNRDVTHEHLSFESSTLALTVSTDLESSSVSFERTHHTENHWRTLSASSHPWETSLEYFSEDNPRLDNHFSGTKDPFVAPRTNLGQSGEDQQHKPVSITRFSPFSLSPKNARPRFTATLASGSRTEKRQSLHPGLQIVGCKSRPILPMHSSHSLGPMVFRSTSCHEQITKGLLITDMESSSQVETFGGKLQSSCGGNTQLLLVQLDDETVERMHTISIGNGCLRDLVLFPATDNAACKVLVTTDEQFGIAHIPLGDVSRTQIASIESQEALHPSMVREVDIQITNPQLVVCGGFEQLLQIWNIQESGVIRIQNHVATSGVIGSVSWSEYQSSTAFWTEDQGMLLSYDIRSRNATTFADFRSSSFGSDFANTALFSHREINEHTILCGFSGGMLASFDTRAAKVIWTMQDPVNRAVGRIQLAPNKKHCGLDGVGGFSVLLLPDCRNPDPRFVANVKCLSEPTSSRPTKTSACFLSNEEIGVAIHGHGLQAFLF